MARSILLIVLLLTGCTTTPAATDHTQMESSGDAVLPLLAVPVLIVDHDLTVVGLEFDVMCQNGGGPRLERTGELASAGTDHFDVQITVDATYSSIQVGYSLDQGEIAWLPPVFGGSATQSISVPEVGAETDVERWTFYYQLNLPGAPQDCYTGAGAGHRSIKISAMPPESSS